MRPVRDKLVTHENSHNTRETIAQTSCESMQQNSHASEILAFLVSNLFSMSAMDNLDVKQNQLKFYYIQTIYISILIHVYRADQFLIIASEAGGAGSNPGRVIPKTLKMVPVATLLGAQH